MKQFLTSQILHQRTNAEGLINAPLFMQQLNSQEMFIDSGCPGRVPIYKSLDLGMPDFFPCYWHGFQRNVDAQVLAFQDL